MDVDAVNSKWFQAGYLQLIVGHLVIHDLVLLFGWLWVRDAAVPSTRRGGDCSAVGVKMEAARTGGVGDAKKISATPIWRPGGGNNREEKHSLHLLTARVTLT